MLAEVGEEWFQDLVEDSGIFGFGYRYFALAYTWTQEKRALVARYYEDIPRGFFLYNASGHIFTSQWQYEGRPEGRPPN